MSLTFGRTPPWDSSRAIRSMGIAIIALAGSTAAVAGLEHVARIPYAAPVYLLAVMAVGLLGGTAAAILTAFASFVLYDFLFIQPHFTLTVADPNEWLNLLLFLAVAVVIGRLAALQVERTEEAAERAREAGALFRISRSLATSRNLAEAAQAVLAQLRESSAMDRVWLGLGPTPADERIVADTAEGQPLPVPTWHVVLQRKAGDEPARWVRTHVAVGTGRRRAPDGAVVHRVRLEVPGGSLGSLWALRSQGERDPSRAETLILSAAADQLGQAVRRDRLIAEALEAEIARRSEALKTALLDSVSHDLRTPLATIRAAAGSLLDEGVTWTPEERRDTLRSIDAEAERMNRLVRNLLDLSRIEGGALRPELEPHDLDEQVEQVLRRIPRTKAVRIDVLPDLPPVLVDDVYLDEVLTNLIENAQRYGGEAIVVRATAEPDGSAVDLVVEDDGPGVPEADMAHLFEKFYRVRRPGEGSRRGMGIGLTVAQGLVRAMGGEIVAGRSPLGGLSMRVRLPAVGPPPEPSGVTLAPEPSSVAHEGNAP
jgi:two-component system, OmpR family, sensor histidine kinase KdpD